MGSENNDIYRQFVVDKFDDIRPLNDYVQVITDKLNYIHKKIRESQTDDEEDNIITATQEKLQLKKLELTHKEASYRMMKLKQMHNEWMLRLDKLIERIKKIKEKKKKR